MIKGISHITLICRDIKKSAQLFCRLFGAVEVYSSDEKNFSLSKEKYLLIGDLWIALMEGEPISRSYNHIAFHIADSELSDYEAKILSFGLEILPSRPRHPREGKSLYFYDYDNHLFELHTGTLQTRLAFYREFSGAAIEDEGGAGDVAGLGRTEPEDRMGDIEGLAEFAEGA